MLLLLPVCLAGVLLARRLDDASSRLADRFALGAALGLAILSATGFLFGWAFGLSVGTIVGAAIATIALCALFGAKPMAAPAGRPAIRPSKFEVVLAIALALVVFRIADRTLSETPQGGLSLGDRHNFGDLPFHMGIAAGFAYGDNFPPDHPELAGVPLTYPFLCDVLSAMILKTSGSWRDAFFWPTFILGLCVIVALVRFGEAVSGSRNLGRIAAALTILSGGLGFLTIQTRDGLVGWWRIGSDLTINDLGFKYANFVTTLFIPQRSILFGWPLLFFALAILVARLKEGSPADGDEAVRNRMLTRAGVIGSLLPLVHSHSFAVLAFCSLFLFAASGARAMAAFLKGLLPLAVPAVLFMASRNSLSTGRFFEWQPGFDGGASNPLRYWLLNAGVFLPLVAIGVFLARRNGMDRRLAIPFAALFLIANLFRLSPWIWDNMKFLAPAHAGLAPFAALALAAIWRRGTTGQAAAAVLFVVGTLSGGLEVAKIAVPREEFGLFDRSALEFAEKVRDATPPGTTILTAPKHNHPVLLSGRREFLGYEGHLWSQGLSYDTRKPVADAIFKGLQMPPGSSSLPRIDAIALTPDETALITDSRAIEGLPSIVESPYRLLKIR